MKVVCCFALAMLAFPIGSPARAGAVPAQLHNKTVSVVWGLSTTWRRISDGVTGSSTSIIDRSIYVSSNGRTFVRQNARTGNNTNKIEIGPEAQSGRFAFEGNTLSNIVDRGGLLWRIAINFDPAFSSCSATVHIGREGKVAKTTGIDGAPYENLSATAGSTSCSVKVGNAFAGQ